MKDNSAQVTQLICTIYDAGCIVYCQKRIGGKLSREVKIRRILYLYVIVTWQVNEACILIDMAIPGLPMFNDYGVDSPLPGKLNGYFHPLQNVLKVISLICFSKYYIYICKYIMI